MKYNLLEIRYGIMDKKIKAFYREEILERKKGKTKPSNLGFYYFPSTMDKQVAFKELKDHLIKLTKKEIIKLQNRIEELQDLKLED